MNQRSELTSQPVIEVIDLSYYWNVIRRNLTTIIALSAVVTIITALVVFSLTPKYVATTTLLIEAEETNLLSIEEVYGISSDSKEYFLTQFEILKSRDIARRVVEGLNLIDNPEFNPFHPAAEKGFSIKSLIIDEEELPAPEKIIKVTIDNFWKSITISPVRKTQLVKISVESRNKAFTAEAANAVANAYIDSQLEAKVGLNNQASGWLGGRLGGLKERLEKSEQELQQFREANSLVDAEGVNTFYLKELERITEKLVDARNNRSNIESTFKQLQSLPSLTYENLSVLPAILKHPLIVRLREQETIAELKVSELSKRYGPKHPRMIAAQSDVDAVKDSVLIQMKRIADGIEQDYLVAKTQEQSLEQSFQNIKKKIQQLNRKEFELNEYTREVQANRSLYDAFFNRVRETSATGGLQTANARIVDPAVLPDFPVKPKKKLIVALAMVASFMFGIALVFLKDALDATIKNSDDVTKKLSTSIVGLIPFVKLDKKLAEDSVNHMAKAYTSDRHVGFSESVRTLRTSLALASLQSPHKVLLFTSSVPGEGKTTTSLNLAAAYGQVEKVLLIDADMRRPTVAKQLQMAAGSPGLSNAILDVEQLDNSIHHFDDLNIDVMPAGVLPPNPLELLSSPAFAELLDRLKQRYQRIIIDSAPMQIVSDALYLSTLVDGTVYVIKADSTKDKYVKGGVERLQQANANVLGVVLNQVDVEKEARYGDYQGGYYSQYGYTSEA